MANEKTNIELLKELFRKHFEEAESLIKKFETQLSDKNERITELEDEIKDYEEVELVEEVFLGLDTIEYRLKGGNLVISQQLEDFFHSIQKQNAVVPA